MEKRDILSMCMLISRFRDEKIKGTISFNAKYGEEHYKKYKLLSPNVACGKEISIKNFRYLNWSDITGFVPSSAYNLPNLSHKRPQLYCWRPSIFDHTSFWREPGDKFPLFCITEPYNRMNDDDLKTLYKCSKQYDLEYKIYDPSKKSLWVPNSTYMIFFWDKKYFNFSDHESILFSHSDSDQFEKELIINI